MIMGSVWQRAGLLFLFSYCASARAALPKELTTFDTNQVLAIKLTISPENWNKLRYEHREAEFFPEEGVPATNAYSWFPAEAVVNGTSIGKVEVRKKGYIGSNDIHRPGLKVRIAGEKGVSRDGGVELTLNNNLQDSSLVHQALAYEVFRRAGVPAPRASFATLKVNGKSLGIYTRVEPINAAFLKRNFGNASGNLYEGGRSDFRAQWLQNFELKNNRGTNNRADLKAVTDAVEGSKGSLLPVVDRYFEKEQFLRFWAVESLINQVDGYAGNMNNFYLYHNPANARFVFIPWGADSTLSFGRPLNYVKGDPKSVIGTGILANRLYNSEEGAAAYRKTLRKVLEDAWNEEVLLREVDRLERLLMPVADVQAEEFKGSLEQVRGFIKGRRAELASELDGPAPALKSTPLELAKRRNVGQFHGRFAIKAGNDTGGSELKQGELSGKLWDNPITFGRTFYRGQVPDAGSESPVVIMITGFGEGSDTQYMMYLAIDPDSYVAGRAIRIDNTRIFGMLGMTEGKGQNMKRIGMLRGTLQLTKAGKANGEEIAGEFNADVFSKLPKP
jgi:spore coat protein CotH